jgi:hypothetical protein
MNNCWCHQQELRAFNRSDGLGGHPGIDSAKVAELQFDSVKVRTWHALNLRIQVNCISLLMGDDDPG